MDLQITAVLNEIKKETGWSGPRIAAEIGVSQPTISRILNGQADCKGMTLMAIIRLRDSLVNAEAPEPEARCRL